MSALGAVGAVYLLVLVGLQAFARNAESSGVVYPYRQEDWLRYLLPSLWPADQGPLVLLTGPSTARENLLTEEFAAAFPGHRVFQGALSLASLTDVMASLAYVERVHGAEALPEIVVLGVSPRFLAEVPAQRPYALGINRYSRWYRVPDGARNGFRLEAKPAVRGMMDQLRFLSLKQAPRYRAAMLWSIAQAIGPGLSKWLWNTPPFASILQSGLGRLMFPRRLLEIGIHDFAIEQVSPHKYLAPRHLGESGLEQWLDDPNSWWADVHRWDPGHDSLAIQERVLALRGFAAKHRMAIYVVDLPERSIGRVRYAPGFDGRFHRFLAAVFDPLPVLDLRCFLSDAEFHDVEHALPEAALRVTRRVIRFMEEISEARAAGLPGPVTDSAGMAET